MPGASALARIHQKKPVTLESIYYVLCWACHRKCVHCYEPRFRPYIKDELQGVVKEAKDASPRIIANLPNDLSYLDTSSPSETLDHGFVRRAGRIILAGGEVLLDPVREEVLYPTLEAIAQKYAGQGVKVIVQTTGDRVTPEIIQQLLSRGVWQISCAGMDDFHVGMQGEKRVPLIERLRTMFHEAGMVDASLPADEHRADLEDVSQPVYTLFGATDDAWIGKIWPRGRAWENSLSKATIEDNFCNAWSGGLNFLNRGVSGSEVSIDPNGDVFPCCLKTKKALGNLQEERLDDILDSLEGHPAMEAISMGHPERMGVSYGWDVERFLEASRTTRPDGEPYRNMCIGCDAFHEQVLAPILEQIREERLAANAARREEEAAISS